MSQNFLDQSEDTALLQKVGEGCQQSFNALYEKYWESTYSAAYKRLKDPDQAKDIIQEIFTHIWFKRETLKIENLPAYLQVSVRNRVFKHLGKQKLNHPFFDVLETLPALHMQADSNLLAKEFFDAYQALIESLSPKKKLIFRLRFQEDLSTKDIAFQLGLSRKTVQNQLGKAIEFLKVSLFYSFLIIAIVLFADAK
jgi:RNA polymerase sigma-70 factor (family 1)